MRKGKRKEKRDEKTKRGNKQKKIRIQVKSILRGGGKEMEL